MEGPLPSFPICPPPLPTKQPTTSCHCHWIAYYEEMQKSTHWALTFRGYGWSARILLFSESCAVNIGQFSHGICSTVDYSQYRGPLSEPCAINTTRKLDSTVMLVNRIWKGEGFWSRISASFLRESRIPSFYHRHPENYMVFSGFRNPRKFCLWNPKSWHL